jgi:hypothetical protein
MFKKIIELFTGKKEPVQPLAVPYKLEAPVVDQAAVVSAAEGSGANSSPANEPPKCGCGRSSTRFCVGLHKLSPEAWASHPNNPDIVGKILAEPARPAKKAAVKKPAAAKKPAAIKAPAKPRAKKTSQ